MAGSGPQQISPPHVESVNVHQQGELHNLEQENHVDNQQEGSSQTIMLVEVAIDEGVTWYTNKLMKGICNEKLKI